MPQSDHFEAKWIPLTEYSDSNPTVRDPYQLATVIVRDANTHVELARTTVVAPVSTEMHCDNCHYNNGPGNEGISSATVEQNILKKHDQENMDEYPAGPSRRVDGSPPGVVRRVSLLQCHRRAGCWRCAQPVQSDAREARRQSAQHHRRLLQLPSRPADQMPARCHVAAARAQHADLHHLPRQHASRLAESHAVAERADAAIPVTTAANTIRIRRLYRMSKDHGGMYCEACHDSTHAIAPSTLPNKDGLKFFQLQGHNGPIDTCNVCHASCRREPGRTAFCAANSHRSPSRPTDRAHPIPARR